MDIKESLAELMAQLEKVLTTKTVFGEPITVGDRTLIPVMSVSLGFGAGGGTGKQQNQEGAGGGAGAGLRINPIAVISASPDQVEVLPLRRPGALGQFIETLPELGGRMAEHLKQLKQAKAAKGKGSQAAEKPEAQEPPAG